MFKPRKNSSIAFAAAATLGLLGSCESDMRTGQIGAASSCMRCHNGSQNEDYTGPGLEDPHPFGVAANLACTTCHGGNPNGAGKEDSHVPAPPEIGDQENWLRDRTAYFNRLTLTGIDKYPDYEVGGQSYTALDYLQFINPGDLRVAQDGRACGQCHEPHVDTVASSPLATEAGVLSGALFAAGAQNKITAHQGIYEDTAADMGFRAITDPDWVHNPSEVGPVGNLVEFPVYSVFGVEEPGSIFRNDDYLAAALNATGLNADNSLITDSPLAHLYHEQVAFTCGDCHLGSAGANNRYGDFRSSGCTACHMRYSLDGRSRSRDPNVNKNEPRDPDDIDPPERAHVLSHRIRSTHKTLPSGEELSGIDDYTCAGCHQGSNRTVMQYWGIRLDQNQDLRNGVQYPANPVSFRNTSGDTRLFDPEVRNNTFNGRNRNQYILFEDYDGDERDDTPPDIHYELGLGCIDCHGSVDLHGGDVAAADRDKIHSRMEQAVAVRCESCHGSVQQYAPTRQGTAHDGTQQQLALDSKDNLLDHVRLESDGHYYLYSRLTGKKHYVVQTRDVVVNNGRTNPMTGEALYSQKASYAMGTADGDPSTGVGPRQTSGDTGFTHMTNLSCSACHSAWTNTCMGCHLEGEYSTNPNNFSNITGERIVFREKNADFVYQSPLFFTLGVGPDNKVRQMSPNTITFFKYEDRQNNDTRVFAFSDRKGKGNNPSQTHPALSHNMMMAHSIRGKVDDSNEGPRYCASCHLTNTGLTAFGESNYDDFKARMAASDYSQLNFTQLQDHFGRNTGNYMESPLWVHMVAGLGSGVFLFDENGCPVNPLDQDNNRAGCDNQAPADNFNLANVHFNMDRLVNSVGQAASSNSHPKLEPGVGTLRDGAVDQNMAGPLGTTLVDKLTDRLNGVVLDSWLDSNGAKQGSATTFIPDPQ